MNYILHIFYQIAPIPETIGDSAKGDKPKCPKCCSEGNCATGFYCNDPEICPGLTNQERNQSNKGGSLFNHDNFLLLGR